jgi:thymidylate kinase
MINGNKFIVVEGIDGSGKTTVCKILSQKIGAKFYKTPSFPFSDIRTLIDKKVNLKSRFFFYLSSVFHASYEINEILKEKTVVCDRYILSTLCYHRAAEPYFKTFDENKMDILQPDLTFYLEADYNIRVRRIAQREHIEFENIFNTVFHDESFQKKVESEFSKYKNLIRIDTNILTAEAVADKIFNEFCL